MSAALSSFLRDLAREPFTYGQNDCVLALANWWRSNHQIDPGERLRGTYSDLEGCEEVLAAEGGVLRLVRRVTKATGMRRIITPAPGDIAVVRFQGKHFGAIRTPTGKWAIKAGDGLIVTQDCRLVAAWSV